MRAEGKICSKPLPTLMTGLHSHIIDPSMLPVLRIAQSGDCVTAILTTLGLFHHKLSTLGSDKILKKTFPPSWLSPIIPNDPDPPKTLPQSSGIVPGEANLETIATIIPHH